MCGGLASALGMRARATAINPSGALRVAVIYQAGRLGGYTLAGLLCGLFGAALQRVLDLSSLIVPIRVASGVLLVLVALRILFAWNALRWLERLGANFWKQLQPLVRRTSALSDTARAAAMGLLWGWLPCGLVYSMLLFAALSGSALRGGAIMLAFGIGTMPSMLTGTLLASTLHRLLTQRWPRMTSGALLLLSGLWFASAALQSMGHLHHH
jgi:sulfite exporter TauE/SafE